MPGFPPPADPTDGPGGASAGDGGGDGEEPTPRSVEREIWRELACQGRALQMTSALTGETHGRLIKVEGDVEAIKAGTTRSNELTAELVTLTRQQAEIAIRQEEREARRTEVAEAAERRRVEAAEAASAEYRGKILDWWATNWKTIGAIVLILLGVNVQPILTLLGMAPAAPVVMTAPPPSSAPDPFGVP